jgi:uncharacterized RDD family membrane protein YckC
LGRLYRRVRREAAAAAGRITAPMRIAPPTCAQGSGRGSRPREERVTVADLVTGEAVVVDIPYARFGSRLLAIIIDLLIQVTLLVVALVLLTRSAGSLDAAALAAIALTVIVFVIVGYPTILETTTRGRSLGKLALGLRVVSENGGPERFRQALMRGLAAVVEIWLLEGAPALICSLLSAKGKRLGDVFAGTVVIQERLPARTGPVAVMPPALAGWAAGLELSRLPDQTAAAARQYLARYYEFSPAARDELGLRIASDVAAVISPPPPPGTPPADYLSAVLAERRARAQARMPAPAPDWPGPAAPPHGPPPHGPPPHGPPPHGPPPHGLPDAAPPDGTAAPQVSARQPYGEPERPGFAPPE